MVRLALSIMLLFLASSALAQTIQMQPHAGGYLIPVQVNGAISLDFVLDTGASEVSIPEEAAQALTRAGTLTAGDFIGSGVYTLADGSRIRSKRVMLRELRVGDQAVANVIASIGPTRSDPLLGQSFLSKFPSWMLDNQRHVLVLSGSREAVGPTASAESSPARLTGTPPYASFGAFGHDEITGKYGYSWNERTQQLADEGALKGCASDACKIVFRTGPRECGAIAMTENGKVWGGAKRPRRDAAELAAVVNCQKRTGDQCRLSGSKCNQ
jgi:clan AA aspartic protease (TIGR02281 family)